MHETSHIVVSLDIRLQQHICALWCTQQNHVKYFIVLKLEQTLIRWVSKFMEKNLWYYEYNLWNYFFLHLNYYLAPLNFFLNIAMISKNYWILFWMNPLHTTVISEYSSNLDILNIFPSLTFYRYYY